ncbi:MAG: TIGR02647 family protein [Cycloclasticus sp.]|nr:TIGR02647 family protein [Cycloclasticus sp.]
MKFNQDIIDELNILIQYDLSNTEQGIKIHGDAESAVINATSRLFKKGLIDKEDGGYLTAMGRIASEHAAGLTGLLLKSG